MAASVSDLLKHVQIVFKHFHIVSYLLPHFQTVFRPSGISNTSTWSTDRDLAASTGAARGASWGASRGV